MEPSSTSSIRRSPSLPYSFTGELHIGKGAEESYDEVGGLIELSIKKDPKDSNRPEIDFSSTNTRWGVRSVIAL